MPNKDTFFAPNTTINCGGKLLDLTTPKVMGVLNVTPDSFYDGGRYQHLANLLRQVEKMVREGAAIIDVGGMSSRPGATIIEVKEELKRVLPALRAIRQQFPEIIVSIDTVQAEVAKQAVDNGAELINDISAGSFDANLLPTVANLQVPYILMHMLGKPVDMQDNPTYQDVVQDISDFFVNKLRTINQLGIKDVILDVGFGFGKTLAQNYTLLKRLDEFKVFELPLLVGISRKSMVYQALKSTAKEALNGTTALHTIALLNGAKLLRVHDIKEARETVELVKYYQQG